MSDSDACVIVDRLTRRVETLAVAESCTGGHLAHLVTSQAGASKVFLEGIVTYSNEAKVRLGVCGDLLREKGAVSSEVAMEMAKACRLRAESTFGLATTGFAGPTAGPEAAVGTAYVALDCEGGSYVECIRDPRGDRQAFMEIVAQKALRLLLFMSVSTSDLD